MTQPRNLVRGAIAATITLFISAAAQAITITHSDRGSFQFTNLVNGIWKTPDGSYQARALNNGVPVEFNRNYTVFDFSLLSGTATGATLLLWLDTPAGPGLAPGYQSSAPSETLSLFSVATDPTELLAGDAGTNPGSVFGDLGSGTPYGSQSMTAADMGSYIAFDLTAALGDINTAITNGSSFAIGGAMSTIDASYGTGGITEGIFRGSATGDPASQLILTGVVPVPAAVWLLGSGLLAFVGIGKRRSR
ncbi:MAG: VPLPA-CTERM sorting domain-containing protein [Pseudomonadota bacterium]